MAPRATLSPEYHIHPRQLTLAGVLLPQGIRGWLRLYENGGRRHDVPAHHRATEALDAYLAADGLDGISVASFSGRIRCWVQ